MPSPSPAPATTTATTATTTSATTPADSSVTTRPTTAAGRALRSRRRLLPAAAVALALLVTGAGTAVARAHKVVVLDVDGTERRVTTFAGSVEGLLTEEGVAVGDRDTVAPAGALADGGTVVVRHARSLLVDSDGTVRTVWTTALTADAALDVLAARDGAVSLVASRSTAGRVDLGVDLSAGTPVEVVVDGTTRAVPDGTTDVTDALGALGVTLGALDRVAVRTGGTGTLQVVVSRVVEQDVTTTSEVAFARTETPDATRTVGTRRVTTAGVAGVRTLVEHVTTVDGVETGRTTVSDAVTQAPVDEVVAVGTKPRPVVAATPVTASADGLNWAALARCESGGNPAAVSASGRYHGLYQFSVATWAAVGGTGLPSQASAAEQTARAQALYARSGAGQWPVCGAKLFG